MGTGKREPPFLFRSRTIRFRYKRITLRHMTICDIARIKKKHYPCRFDETILEGEIPSFSLQALATFEKTNGIPYDTYVAMCRTDSCRCSKTTSKFLTPRKEKLT